MRTTVCFTLLLVIAMAATVSAQGGTSSCCIQLSKTRIHRDFLQSYYQQRLTSCKIHAVVFITVKQKRICADPHRVWTKTSMAYLDGKNYQNRSANLLVH